MGKLEEEKIARVDQMSVFALVLLEGDKCFSYKVAINRSKEMATRKEGKSNNTEHLLVHGGKEGPSKVNAQFWNQATRRIF